MNVWGRNAVLFRAGLLVLVGWSAFCLAGDPGPEVSPVTANQSHEAQILDWREKRHARLANEDGWLSLVGLEWLREGKNRVGSGSANDVRVPGGPEVWGTIVLHGDKLTFIPAATDRVTIDGRSATESTLLADNAGDPTIVRSGNLSFYVIFRGSYALRVKDTQAPTLLAFAGVESYPIDPSWRFEARFVPADPGQTIEITNVLGQVELMPVGGTVEFERDGRTFRLLGLNEKGTDSLWFLFADRTTGRETYGAGRFLYSDGKPENGRVVVDFNKAYNPPCAFNDYSTCPLPPQQNRLDLDVTAGEKNYHQD